MDNAKFQDYIKNRYEDQMNWYDRKASQNQKEYKKWTRIVIILSALTPIVAALDAKSIALAIASENSSDLLAQIIKIILITISAIVAIGTTTLKTFRYHELWISYRETCERLRSEKYLFDARLGIYSQPRINLRAAFVEQIEAALMKEHSGWVSASKSAPSDLTQTTDDVNANVEKARGGKTEKLQVDDLPDESGDESMEPDDTETGGEIIGDETNNEETDKK